MTLQLLISVSPPKRGGYLYYWKHKLIAGRCVCWDVVVCHHIPKKETKLYPSFVYFSGSWKGFFSWIIISVRDLFSWLGLLLQPFSYCVTMQVTHGKKGLLSTLMSIPPLWQTLLFPKPGSSKKVYKLGREIGFFLLILKAGGDS